MTYLFIITLVIIAIVAFLLGKSFAKVIKPTSKQIVEYTIDNVKFVNELNPIVKDIYLLFIKEDVLKEFVQNNHRITVPSLNISFWDANGVDYMHLEIISSEHCKKYNKTEKELGILSPADMKILHRISNAIRVNNAEFISRLFI